MGDSLYEQRYSGKSLEQLKQSYNSMKDFEEFEDERGRRTVKNKSSERQWLKNKIHHLENPASREVGQSSASSKEVEATKNVEGGRKRRKSRKTRKQKKHTKKSRKHRK